MASSHFEMRQGKTFKRVLRWATLPYVYKDITAITKAAPARITATGHGVVDGWPVWVVSVEGMRQINAVPDAPGEAPDLRYLRKATYVDANTITLNSVNSKQFSAYGSGGALQYLTPQSLTGCEVRLTIRDRPGGTSLLALTSNPAAGIVLDDTLKTITVTITDEQTAAFAWTSAVWEAEIQTAAGEVYPLGHGTVTVKKELPT